MLHLENERLKQNIGSVCRTVREIHAFLTKNAEPDMDRRQQLAFRSAETALLALAASDEAEAGREPSERLPRQQLSSALRQIAIHLLNVQEWASAGQLEAEAAAAAAQARAIARMTELPDEPEGGEEPLFSAPEPIRGEYVEALALTDMGADPTDRLKGEIRALREILTALLLERDDLIHVVGPALEAAYMRQLGSIEAEIYRAECEIRYLRRKTELMQAALNRREEIRQAQIDAELRAQYDEYQKTYREFIRRVREASDFLSRRKRKTARQENGSGQETAAGPQKRDEAREAEDEEKQLKKLYRRIVKAMHPDLHPGQDEAAKELFRRAILAYKDGDLKTLTEIAHTLDGGGGGGDDPTGALLAEKTRLLTLIHGIRAEIRLIGTRFPFTKKALLDDPAALEAEKKKLNAKLETRRKQAEVYRKRIAEMEEADG